MSESMIERVARALRSTLRHHCVEMHPDVIRELAHGAIVAMREPTEAMAEAGEDAQDIGLGWPAIYVATIDAALAEEG